MADTKEGREKQAKRKRQRREEREIKEARARGDEDEPPEKESGESEIDSESETDPDAPRECHRRGCTKTAEFVVLERYQEETGHGAVEAEVFLCREHADEESPTNLDRVYEDYVFQVVPITET